MAVDFTGSNGNPSSPSSLHYLGPKNQYESAIMQVGSILEPYDADRCFPTFGFGGVPNFMGIQATSHCFPLNGNPQNPGIVGVEGIRQVYRQNLPRIQLSGPTYFSEIIQQFNSYAVGNASSMAYQILLILTDGEIHDMDRVKKLIVDASSGPTSVIIVGVGNEAFTMMEALDSDGQLLRSSDGRTAKRDIV